MDRKRKSSSRRPRRRRGTGGGTVENVPFGPRTNQMSYSWSFDFGVVSANTSGTISLGDISPSIQNSSEYSTVSSLFTECRLVRCTVRIVPQVGTAALVTGSVMMGTQMASNLNTFTAPTQFSNVQNLAGTFVIPVGPFINRTFRYNMVVPRRLEYSSITSDAPATVTPWAGSPGVVQMFGQDLTASASYIQIFVDVTHMLRGRV